MLGLQCRHKNKTKSILKRRNNVEIENCQTAVGLGGGKTISNGMQNNVGDGAAVKVVHPSVCVCVCVCVCVSVWVCVFARVREEAEAECVYFRSLLSKVA